MGAISRAHQTAMSSRRAEMRQAISAAIRADEAGHQRGHQG